MKLSSALLSGSMILVLGLSLWKIFDTELSLFGSLGWWSLPIGCLLGVVLYALAFYATKVFWMRSSSMKSLMETLHQMFKEFSWLAIIVVSILAGVGEELLLRGFLQTELVGALGPAIGIVLASLCFGLMHFLSKTYVLVTFAIGLVFGLAYHYTDSLLLVMITHAVYDVFAFAVLVKYPGLLNIGSGDNHSEMLSIK